MKIGQRCDPDDDDDESDKHLEARDRRYSCLITFKFGGVWHFLEGS